MNVFQCRGCRFNPGQGTKIPHATGQLENPCCNENPEQPKKNTLFLLRARAAKVPSPNPWTARKSLITPLSDILQPCFMAL